MDKPTVMRLHGVRWDIRYLTNNEFLLDAKQELLGHSKHTETALHVLDTLQPDRMRAVLWHEIFHAVEGDAGFDFTEEQVRAMAAGLFAVLRDNKALAAWLLEE